MIEANISWQTSLCFLTYVLSLSCILFNKSPKASKLPLLSLTLFLIACLLTGHISPIAIPIVITGYFVSSLASIDDKRLVTFSWVLTSCFSLLMAFHLLPGFNNVMVFETDGLGISEKYFSQYVSLDKGIAGLLIINLANSSISWISPRTFFLKLLPASIAFSTLILLLGHIMGLAFDPKIGWYVLLFFAINLLITCVAEEAFFRLIVQRNIDKFAPPIYGVIISAGLFTSAHFHTGPGATQLLSLIFLAGILYACVYNISKSFGAAIFCHAILNLIHLTLFEYPASF